MKTEFHPRYIARFWQRVKIPYRGDGCWQWIGTCQKPGKGPRKQLPYGIVHCDYNSRPRRRLQMQAHRFSWLINVGPIPDGLCVCHHCDNPRCVRPDHLWLGTHQQNMDDAARKGRMGTKRYDDERVDKARVLVERGLTYREAGKQTGIHPNSVWYTVNRRKKLTEAARRAAK